MMRRIKLLAINIFVALLGVLVFSASANAATYTVTNTNDSGAGSLRQAITSANSTIGSDTIDFSIGSGAVQIVPTSALPPVIYPVTIDGTTQPGFGSAPIVELSGNGAGANARGFYVSGNGAGSTIRGLIINRFSAQGIFVDTNNVTIVGNYIGTNAAGTAAAANGSDGIGIFSGTNLASANGNIVGGTTAADRNVVSGNTGNGIAITAQDNGTTNNNTVQGNYIGTNAAGMSAIANGGDGFLLNNAQGVGTMTGNMIGGTTGVTVGGACTGACNLMSGNIANGAGLWHSGASGNTFKGNYVGTNVAGTAAVANGDIGLEVNETPNNTVGGTDPEDRNILSGNKGAGLFITGAAATGNVVQGNYIGTNASGNSALANQKMGIGIGASPGAVGANSNTIGGTTGVTVGGACTGACNLISGNLQNGVFISGTESYGNTFIGNYVGTNAAGTGSIGNVLDGFGILNTPNMQIGGSTSAHRNVIAGNGSNGLIIVGNATTGVRIEGNYIGMNTAGNSMGNVGSGVAVSSATDLAILGNSIAFNGRLGIDLDNNGSTNLNDAGDGDGGANRTQNFPNVYAAKTSGGTTKIAGQFNGAPNTSFRLEFFSSDGCNAGTPFNYGEGQSYLGSTDIGTDQFGNTAWGFTPGSAVSGGKYITATATKKLGSVPSETSEFSLCRLVNSSRPALTNGAGWFLKNDLTTGPGDQSFGYGFPAHLLMCAWDADQPGVKLPVVYSGGAWYMRASYTTGAADRNFSYGGSDHKPVCGDWNGDGIETVGVVSSNMTWSLRNSNTSGGPDVGAFSYGSAGKKPIVGDWDGDGDDTPGVVDSSNNWDLVNAFGGAPDASFNYGHTPGYAVVGDWDGDGDDTVGSVSTGGTWSLRNSNSGGAPNGSFQFGFPGAVPLTWH